ncbi:MAG TPA: aspartyl protease family protein, partial [Tepidisphaeraceae bacterium]|nr:aspartyl protease family protein [Tepidisphaeraceae bacterium]
MLSLRAAIGIILLAEIISATSGASTAQEKKAEEAAAGKPAITIPLHRGRDRLFAKATIDGVDMGFLAIDTGSTFTCVYTDIANRLGWRRLGSRWVNTQEGNKRFEVAIADSLKVG